MLTASRSKWERIGPPDAPSKCLAMTFDRRDPKVIYIGCRPQGLFRSPDEGITWSWCDINAPLSTAVGVNQHSLRINPYAPDNLWVGIERHGIFKSADNGRTWANLSHGLSGSGLNGICFAFEPRNPAIVYYGSDGGLYKTIDAGQQWTALRRGLPRLESNGKFIPGTTVTDILLHPANPEIAYAGFLFTGPQDSCGVYKTIDGGKHWRPTLTGMPNGKDAESGNDLKGVRSLTFHPTDPRTLFATLEDRGIYQSTGGGETWTLLNANFAAVVTSFLSCPSEPLQCYAGLKDGSIYESTDGGMNWTSLSNGLKVSEKRDPVEYILYEPDGTERNITGYRYQSEVFELSFAPSNLNILYAATADGLFKADISQRVQP